MIPKFAKPNLSTLVTYSWQNEYRGLCMIGKQSTLESFSIQKPPFLSAYILQSTNMYKRCSSKNEIILMTSPIILIIYLILKASQPDLNHIFRSAAWLVWTQTRQIHLQLEQPIFNITVKIIPVLTLNYNINKMKSWNIERLL